MILWYYFSTFHRDEAFGGPYSHLLGPINIKVCVDNVILHGMAELTDSEI